MDSVNIFLLHGEHIMSVMQTPLDRALAEEFLDTELNAHKKNLREQHYRDKGLISLNAEDLVDHREVRIARENHNNLYK